MSALIGLQANQTLTKSRMRLVSSNG